MYENQDTGEWQRLHRQLEKQTSIINGISDAIMMLDAKTYRVLEVNQAFLDKYKIGYEQLAGKACYEITHHQKRPCSQLGGSERCPLEVCTSTGEMCHVEHVHKAHDGNNLYFEITAYPLKDEDGEVTRIIHLSRDISDRRQTEEELKEKLSQSERLTALGQLVAEITHEIRNPLMMIGGFAKQLLPATGEGTKVKKLTIIIEQVKRLETLLADLREFFLPKTSALESVNIRAVLGKVISLVENECAKNHIQIEIVSQEEPFYVRGDQGKLEQVFLNVIKNAIEAMEEGGHLSIRVNLSGDKADIAIEDEGCGIPEEHMDKILECFFTTKSYGSGLGLCISKKYIDGHEGSYLSVESEEGTGTTVNIGLSLYPEPPDNGLEDPLTMNHISFDDRADDREMTYLPPPVAS